MRGVLQKISPSFVTIRFHAPGYDLLKIDVTNESGEMKISVWEEVHSGPNQIPVDLSSLCRGKYKVSISDLNGQIKTVDLLKI